MTAATYRGQSKEQSLGEKLGNATVGPKASILPIQIYDIYQ